MTALAPIRPVARLACPPRLIGQLHDIEVFAAHVDGVASVTIGGVEASSADPGARVGAWTAFVAEDDVRDDAEIVVTGHDGSERGLSVALQVAGDITSACVSEQEGDDRLGDGTRARPWRTVRRALAAANDITILDGEHALDDDGPAPRKPEGLCPMVRIGTEEWMHATIIPGWERWWSDCHPDVRLQNLRVLCRGNNVFKSAASLLFENCTLQTEASPEDQSAPRLDSPFARSIEWIGMERCTIDRWAYMIALQGVHFARDLVCRWYRQDFAFNPGLLVNCEASDNVVRAGDHADGIQYGGSRPDLGDVNSLVWNVRFRRCSHQPWFAGRGISNAACVGLHNIDPRSGHHAQTGGHAGAAYRHLLLEGLRIPANDLLLRKHPIEQTVLEKILVRDVRARAFGAAAHAAKPGGVRLVGGEFARPLRDPWRGRQEPLPAAGPGLSIVAASPDAAEINDQRVGEDA